jgi:hypothetical protein
MSEASTQAAATGDIRIRLTESLDHTVLIGAAPSIGTIHQSGSSA